MEYPTELVYDMNLRPTKNRVLTYISNHKFQDVSIYSLITWLIGKHLSDVFPIRNGLKQGDALLPLLLNFF